MQCADRNCPTHGSLATRGMVVEGVVVSDKMQSTVIVERERLVKVRKYDRYRRLTSRIPAHNPPCVNAKVGDKVRVMECRKLSKTVNFVITGKAGGQEKAKPAKEIKSKKKAKKKGGGRVKKEAADG